MTVKRYRTYPDEVNNLLDFARETRKLQRHHPEHVNAADILQHVSNFAANWGWDLLDIVLDDEEHIGLLDEVETMAEQARVHSAHGATKRDVSRLRIGA